MPRFGLVLALGLTLSAVAGAAMSAEQAPRASRPRPAPPGPPAMPPLPPALIDDALAIGGDDVKARKSQTRLTVEVRLNGRGPYQFIVDSGADTSAVGLRIARHLQLPLGTPVIVNGMTARNLVDRVKLAELSLGPSTIGNLQVAALREEDLGAHGMIGIDALVRQRLMMDFEKRLIKVEDASKPYKWNPGDIVVTARRQRGQLILTQVQAGGVSLEAVVDTGTEITVGNLALRDKLIKRRAKFETIPVTGVTGITKHVQLARVGELRLGSVTLRDVPIAFADLPPFEAFGLAGEPALLLGTDLLETFRRVSLDFHGRKVRFQLRRCGATDAFISTSPMGATRLISNKPEVCNRTY